MKSIVVEAIGLPMLSDQAQALEQEIIDFSLIDQE
jgi:hypothetical protein